LPDDWEGWGGIVAQAHYSLLRIPFVPVPRAEAKSRINKWLAFSPGEDLAIRRVNVAEIRP